MKILKRHTINRIIAAMLCSLLLFALPLFPAEAEEIPAAGKTINPMVRVLLRRLGVTDRMDLTLTSAYALTTLQGTELHLAAGSEISVQLKSGSLYLYYEGLALNAGKALSLTRYSDPDALEIGFRLTGFPALYIGDLKLDIDQELLRPILTLHVEDYLLGVVPYEMSDSFPLEALKAQTVAARTYVLRKQNANADYDVVDTTNDQVFKGYQEGFTQSEKAVAETYGVCGFYQGKLAQCYYAASNGGQTERVETVWPSDEDFSYYTSTEDPYDVENPSSIVKRTVLQKAYTNVGKDVAAYGLRNLLAAVLKDPLTARGYDPAPESIQVRKITDVSLTGATEGNKQMTALHLTVTVNGRTRTDTYAENVIPAVALVDTDTEEVSLFETVSATVAPTVTPTATADASVAQVEASLTPAPTPSPTPIPVYGPFTEIEEAFVLDIPIFPVAESKLAMNISGNYENELWTMTEDSAAYTLEARRFGHGVGMSQRGAEWMAGLHQKTYKEILAFYYPGMEIMRFDEEETPLTAASEELSATAGPPPTPTPRPTLMPVSQSPTGEQWIATVTGIDDDSSLNLRSLPDLSGDVLMRLFKHQRLLVLERCQEDGWVRVSTDAVEGYVMESYLTAE
ncbi:MAG: SpoIID/LytB domain-containing protein [Eubacteriales bacterium]|nr:SpoIID/LytB domain-containing protein [Eubacteriales bacterium]